MRRLLSARSRVAALALLAAATAAVPLVAVSQVPAAAAARAAGPGFGRAVEIKQPGNAAATEDAGLYAVACSGRGYCSAGGAYTDDSGYTQAMVVTQAHGKWGRGVEVKMPHVGPATDPDAQVNGVACTSPGNCVAVGYFAPTNFTDEGFIVTQRHGTWGAAVPAGPLPAGTASSTLSSVTCPAAGSCEAVGFVLLHSTFVGLVLAQSHGRWTQDRTLSPPKGGGPELAGIGCTRPGDCVAVGYYFPTNLQTFSRPVAYDQSHGRWGHAITVQSPGNLSGDLSGFITGACVPGGSCLAAGYYESGSKDDSMAAAESGGKWKRAVQITAVPRHALGASVYGVSCASSRLCVGAGGYSTSPANLLAYLVTDVSGRWQDAGGVSLPSNAISPARSFLYTVGCASDGYCAATGYYDYKISGNTAWSYPMVAVRG
jgi:hypothetical protein